MTNITNLGLVRSVVTYMVATLFFVSLDSLAKHMMAMHPLGMVIWGRYAASIIIIALALPFAGITRTVSTNHLGAHFLRGACLVGATAFMFLAVKSLPVALSYAISYVSPLIVLAIAAATLKERITRLQAIGAVVSFTGVLMIIRPGTAQWQWEMLFPLGSAVCYASYQVLTRAVGRHDSPLTSLLYVTLSGAILASLTLPWSYTPASLSTWALIGALGLLGTIGHFLLISAYKGAPASILAPFIYVQIIWAALIDTFIFNTSITPVIAMGALVVIGGGLLILISLQDGKEKNLN